MAMLSLVWLLILMMRMWNTDADSDDIILVSKNSGECVVLPYDQVWGGLETRPDFRWTHPHLLLNNSTTKCQHGRCELLRDGSLRFNWVQAEDSGNYTLEVYDEGGRRKVKKVFLLQVKDVNTSSVKTPLLICCFLLLFLLFFFITFFILRKRMTQTSVTSGHKEENIYVMMHGNHGNKGKHEEEIKEEEPLYVSCKPLVAAEQAEDIYV